ncbi:MAG: D-alanine--poly(phosphoribitol) ligase, subunit 1, partial [Sporolactobacillus laevolacticus]|nr:D-alanine--poly(phosphoribitol) ligase, subunit 1 [Sporolactobacillus laevolacticus]
MDIIAQIDKWAEQVPDRLCYVHRDHQLTFGELKKRSDAIACWIQDRLGDDRTPLIIHGHMHPIMPVLFLACAKSGH